MKINKKRIFHGIGANGFNQVVNILIQLITVPFFIQSWGVELYGEWIILSTIPSYFFMSNMGFINVAENMMAIEVSSGKKKNAIETYQSTFILLTIITVILFLMLIVIKNFNINISEILNIKLLDENQVFNITEIYILSVMINFYYGLITAGFRCEGDYVFITWIGSIGRLLELFVVVTLLIIKRGPIELAVAICFSKVMIMLISYSILTNKYKWFKFGIKNFKIKVLKLMLQPSLSFVAYDFGNILKLQGILNVIGIIIGPVAVVIFTTTRTLFSTIQQINGIVSRAICPEISFAYGEKNHLKIKKLYLFSMYSSSIISLLLLIVLGAFGRIIIEVWTNNKIQVDGYFFYLMLMTYALNSVWSSSSSILVATNNHQTMAILNLFLTIFTILSIYIISPYFGLIAVPLGYIIMEMIMIKYVLAKSLNLANIKIIDIFKK